MAEKKGIWVGAVNITLVSAVVESTGVTMMASFFTSAPGSHDSVRMS